jgi:hypothetical protein
LEICHVCWVVVLVVAPLELVASTAERGWKGLLRGAAYPTATPRRVLLGRVHQVRSLSAMGGFATFAGGYERSSS